MNFANNIVNIKYYKITLSLLNILKIFVSNIRENSLTYVSLTEIRTHKYYINILNKLQNIFNLLRLYETKLYVITNFHIFLKKNKLGKTKQKYYSLSK